MLTVLEFKFAVHASSISVKFLNKATDAALFNMIFIFDENAFRNPGLKELLSLLTDHDLNFKLNVRLRHQMVVLVRFKCC